jgi:predicted N-formylglutamate amidohydrolase
MSDSCHTSHAKDGDIARASRQQEIVTAPWIDINGFMESPLLLIADHASCSIPHGMDLGIPESLLSNHIALDIGVAELGERICTALRCPGIMGGISRLVIDYNREEDAPHIIPQHSDGHAIPGNQISAAEKARRIAQFYHPYHARIAEQIAVQRPKLLISLHSFTPQLASRPDDARPWEVGILYNNDDRAARIAIPPLASAGVIVGDQLPYSGKDLNATMNRHGEGNGIAYLGIEMRQDLIGHAQGQADWADRLAPLIHTILNQLDNEG